MFAFYLLQYNSQMGAFYGQPQVRDDSLVLDVIYEK